uniref:Uncharacterized protein n=1 Tax=Serinus canaria TaxID=9135 RepID=A0A8C9NK45_SERCA
MAATVERRLAQFRAARGSAAAAPRPDEPPGKATAPEAAEGPRAAAEGPGGGAQVSTEAGGGCGGRPEPDAASPRRLRRSGPAQPPLPLWARPAAAEGAAVGPCCWRCLRSWSYGLPYFVLSLLYWMYAGTRGPAERRPGELSAVLRLQPRLRRHRRDADGRARSEPGAALPARRGQLAPDPAGLR